MGLTLTLAVKSMHQENLRVGTQAVEQMDRLLSAALATADTLLPMIGKRCESVLPDMRMAVASNPWVRSASVMHKDEPYCSTLLGRIGKAPAPNTAPQNTLLMTPNLKLQGPDNLAEDFGSLSLTKAGAASGVRVMLDNRLLVDRLDLLSGPTDVALHVGGVYLWDDGSLLRGELRQNPKYRTSVPSSQFDYAMHSSVSAEDVLNLLTEKLVTVLGTLSVVAILTGGLCHWVLTRPRREP
ncbi:CSS-motif domain-containing protein [Pseudomonas entomophila]|uniref:CSS-motif domain-containing protein n=1 Tax=Pseudomonas sp. RIT-PI-S TaxID=3035295 RepID=UPI0021D8D722